jgi:shikimate dehydrogenase
MKNNKSAVIGYPVKHSLSPILHGYWLSKYNIDGHYGLLEIKPDEFKDRFKNLANEGYIGCNITIPYKENVLDIVDKYSQIAKIIGAVNTVVFHKDGTIEGTNTDSYGFIENIKKSLPFFNFNKTKVVVLGAGGAARAVIYGLLKENVSEVVLLNRTKQRAIDLKNALSFLGNITVVDWEERNLILKTADILVNTTSLGMQGQEELDICLSNLPISSLVTDIVYRPLETKLLKSAKMRGNLVVDGIGMLLYQAVSGFNIWFGIKPDVTKELKAHVLKNL